MKTAHIAALLSSEAGQALVQRYLGQEAHGSTVKAQQQAQQLAVMLSTDAGRAALQQQLSGYLVRKQQQQVHAATHGVQSPASGSAPSLTSVGRADGFSAAKDSQARLVDPAASHSSASLKSLPPRVLSTAIAVASTTPGTTERAVGLAALKRELLQHGAVPAALALVKGNGDVLEPAVEGFRAASAGQQQLQHQRSVVSQAVAALQRSKSCAKLSASAPQTIPSYLIVGKQAPKSPVSEAPETLASAWALLQKQGSTAAHGTDLMRLDTQMSGVCYNTADDHSPKPGGLMKSPSQVVFKRRANNSTALRRHFSNVHKAAAAPSRTESNMAAVGKPHQVFKKQRKRPLVLWTNGSNLAQQAQAAKSQQQVQSMVNADYSYDAAASTSLLTGSAATVFAAEAAAAAVASPAPVARAASTTSTVENVLNTLARQEQQLLVLQQQLRQQRDLMLAGRQASYVESPAPVASGLPALQQLLMQAQCAAAQPADVVMEDAWQPAAVTHQQPEVAPDAVAALVALAKQLAAAQMQNEKTAAAVTEQVMGPAQAVQGPAWSAQVLTKLTAALLAA